MLRRYAVAKALFAFTRHLTADNPSLAPGASPGVLSRRHRHAGAKAMRPAARRGAGRGRPKRVPRSTATRHPGRAARLISLRHPWRRSNRRPLGGGLRPHAMTALKFGARFLSITPFHRSGGAAARSRRRSSSTAKARCAVSTPRSQVRPPVSPTRNTSASFAPLSTHYWPSQPRLASN